MHSIIKAKTIVVEEVPERGALTDGLQTDSGPRVELVRVGGRVMAIELSCSCGDVHVVELDYAEAGAGGVAGAPNATTQEAA